MSQYNSQSTQRRGCCLALVAILFVLLILAIFASLFRASVISMPAFGGHSTPTSTLVVQKPKPTRTPTPTPNKEPLGLSDGKIAFDTTRADGSFKVQAAMDLQHGDTVGAQALWQQALNLPNESNDAEALIYLEDQRVITSGQPYVTLVVGTLLTGGASDLSTGRDDLQGAYVAQKEYNDGYKLKGGLRVHLLIANAGGESTNVTTVAQQVVQEAQQDPTFVGVMGWPYSSYAAAAVPILAAAHIPMVSQTASSDALTNISPFFFRVAPSNKAQAIAGASFAEHSLQAKNVVIFVDPNNPYSSSLAQDFGTQFTTDGNQILFEEQYTVGKPNTIPTLLQDALNRNPDLLYFAGYADDMGTLLTDIGTTDPKVKILGGDALYQLQGYPSSARPAFDRLNFTAFAHPSEWDVQGSTVQGLKPTFFTTYNADFDRANQYPFTYGYGRPDNDVMLSYDAIQALLQGANKALATISTLTPLSLQKGLQAITGAQAIQGVSGQISFGSDGNPIKKAVVVLAVDQNDYIQIQQVENCFLTPSPTTTPCNQ